MTDLPKAVVGRYVDEVLNGKNPSAAEALIRTENLKQRVAVLLIAFPDLQVTVHRMIAEGNTVAVHASASGTHLAPFQGMPETGKRWHATCSALYEVADGGIADAWVNWDLLAILEQIGAVRRAEGASA